jgi:dTDP-4-dehydrorhamnose reductase
MGKKRIALIGADGQLGSDLVKTLDSQEVHPLYYPDFDITDTYQTKKMLHSLSADVVINTAAYHRVDECEDNPEKSFAVNTIAVRELAFLCRELDAILVHFSTDYVFDGKKHAPYVEDDLPNPLSVYAVSKLAGEYFVQNILKKYFLIRTCGLYGEVGCWGKGINFVDTMINLSKGEKPIRVVNDQWATPTSTAELAPKVNELLQTTHWGLYHLTNEGECTWYEFAETILELLDSDVRPEAVDSRTFGAKAPRPGYSVLRNRNAEKIGITPFSHWKTALQVYLKKKGCVSS